VKDEMPCVPQVTNKQLVFSCEELWYRF